MNKKLIAGVVGMVLFSLSLIAETRLSVSIEPGEHWLTRMWIAIIPVNKPPQVAVWMETEDGEFIDTLLVTGRTAKQEWRSAPSEGRPESLPVWSHASVHGDGDLDAASSATPEDSMQKARNISLLRSGETYIVRAEVNHSYNYNEYWNKKAKPGSPQFSGINGQPSVVYEGRLENRVGQQVQLIPVGRGAVDGKSGGIIRNLNGLTTALSIVSSISVSVDSE